MTTTEPTNGTALVALEPVQIREVYGGYENDGRMLKTGVLANHTREFESVKFGHADIHKNDGNIILQQTIKGFRTGIRFDEVLPQFAEDYLITQQFSRLIIDHQDVHFFMRTHRPILMLTHVKLAMQPHA